MSSLIVVCPHCLTWIEPHADRCTECGIAVDLDVPDLDVETLAARLGEPLLELGPIRLERRGWPGQGHLIATSEGLLFVPDFVSRPNGAIEPRAEESEPAGSWLSPLNRAWWWPSVSQKSSVETDSTSDPAIAAKQSLQQRLYDSPGGLFVQRTSVRRLLLRWNHLQIERRPARSVILKAAQGGHSINELAKRLGELPHWRGD